jgi:hypothetical protein
MVKLAAFWRGGYSSNVEMSYQHEAVHINGGPGCK